MKISLSDQIDMLLDLHKKEEALQKALSCGDTDLGMNRINDVFQGRGDNPLPPPRLRHWLEFN